MIKIKYVLQSHHNFIVSHDGNNMETKKSRCSKLYNYLPTIYEGIVNNENNKIFYIIYINYINLTKKLVVPLKNRKKKWGHFLFLDIFKMSNFEKAMNKFYKKIKKSIFTHRCFKHQKNTQNVVTIKFLMKK